MPVSIVEQGGRIVVCTPYHPNFPARARLLGGDWDALRHVWIFDAHEDDRVRALCREIYGTDGADGLAPISHTTGQAGNEFSEGAAVPHYFGHRQRLRERMIAGGAESLPDYELLEVILFAARARGDVKPVAKALLGHFGGFAEMMSADPDALAAAGLNLAGMAAIKAAREAALRLMRAELQQRPVVNSWDKLIDYCSAQVAHGKIEFPQTSHRINKERESAFHVENARPPQPAVAMEERHRFQSPDRPYGVGVPKGQDLSGLPFPG